MGKPITRKPGRFLWVSTEGWPFFWLALALTILFFWLYPPVGFVLVTITLWVLWFFRDPDRDFDFPPGTLVSPADGTVLKVEQMSPESGSENELWTQKVSIFMSIFNVHINRIPVKGTIERIHYQEGKFLPAFAESASWACEKNTLDMKLENNVPIRFSQIAGLIARRIICFAKEGEAMDPGERFGMIRFGSRMDIYLTDDFELTVHKGQRVKAGQTQLGQMRAQGQ